jgi:acetylornithine deacetylase/succinyl-diaminopimelate desuccinylase-like protein
VKVSFPIIDHRFSHSGVVLMDRDFVSRQKPRLLAELTEFLAIPSISTLPEHAPDCRRAAKWLMDHLTRLGCPVVQLLEGKGLPVVWAESPRIEGAPTILIYGHYDVQPVEPLDEWISPPFEATIRDGRLYARGAVDDKGQVYCLLKAYEAVCGADGKPPLNVHFIFEGEEECGGQVIFDLLKSQPERTKVAAVVVADMNYFAKGRPAVYTSLRGLCYCELHVRTTERDLHSGSYGGVAPNGLETLCRMLMDLKSRDGTINVPGLYQAVVPPTKAETDGWATLPFDEAKYLHDEIAGKALTGLPNRTVFERTWALPTFEIHGIRGGFTGEGAKTVIPAAGVAKISLRLVPGLPLELVRGLLEKAVAAVAPPWATWELKFLHGADPVQIDVTDPVFQLLDDAFKAVVGAKSVAVRGGGSIPVVTELARGGAPVLLTGIGLPDDGLHSPNEKVDVQQIWDGIEVFGRFFEAMGRKR